MERKNKYTHLIERVAGLPKALAADLLKRQTGLPLAQNYWRLREGKGLLNIFDQTWLKDRGMDLTESPDSCLWTMSASDREAWRQRPRSLVDRILRLHKQI